MTLASAHYSCPDNTIGLVGRQLETVGRKFSYYYYYSLPTHVRNAPTLVAFREELKTMLFRECFAVD